MNKSRVLKLFLLIILTAILISTFFLMSYFNKDNLEQKLKNDKALYSVIISKNNKVIFKNSYNDKTDTSLFNIQSEIKSIMAILIGIAIDKGYIKNVDQKISEFFPEINNDSDTLKKQITIRHLLNQTSGLQSEDVTKIESWTNNADPVKFVLSPPLSSKPGEVYKYNSAATHLLSVIISKATNQNTEQFARESLFQPLGITHYKWEKLNYGYYDGGGLLSIWMKSDDLLKIGQLILNNGKWKDKQIITKKWVAELLNKNNKRPAPWGLRGSLHGFCWYQTNYNNHLINYTMGYGGQYIFVIPDLTMVIVVNHNHDTAKGIEQSTKFIETILPSIFGMIEEEKITAANWAFP